ncbi:hypothetical protein BaRGS_00007178 [Batillaria attramentaria]|uniref:Uncharacterized protein n=1 Tax=Batillaria attramentaria TaxID=370345 RepID=A0ABD0LRU0_9CAEN
MPTGKNSEDVLAPPYPNVFTELRSIGLNENKDFIQFVCGFERDVAQESGLPTACGYPSGEADWTAREGVQSLVVGVSARFAIAFLHKFTL